MKKERTGKLCNWPGDVLLHVHDDRNIRGGGWEGRREAKKKIIKQAVTFRGLEMPSLSILAVSSVLLDQIWSGKELVLRL